ncbi:hypothetical protein B5P44_07900 [Mycobacterium sp. CBMA 213]|nr:hypothetical protein [Mycolicibacterium sp. CBMA 213]
MAASVAPVLQTAHPTPIRGAEFHYTLTAAAFQTSVVDAAFNPISYLGNVGGAALAVASDVIYWQTPDFPLLILSAQVDPSTGEYVAVQKVSSTTTHLQNLVSAVTSIPGTSSSSQVKQLVSGIGSAGAAAAGTTRTVTATLAPHLAPLAPVIYVVRVLSAAVGVYYAVATLSTTGLGTVFSGQNPLTAVANVVASVQGLSKAIANVPHPSTTASQLVAKTTAAAVTQLPTGAAASLPASPKPVAKGTSGTKSSATQSDSDASSHNPAAKPTPSRATERTRVQRSADDAAAPKSTTAPANSKTAAAEKPTPAKRAEKTGDHTAHDSASGHQSAPKTKGEH